MSKFPSCLATSRSFHLENFDKPWLVALPLKTSHDPKKTNFISELFPSQRVSLQNVYLYASPKSNLPRNCTCSIHQPPTHHPPPPPPPFPWTDRRKEGWGKAWGWVFKSFHGNYNLQTITIKQIIFLFLQISNSYPPAIRVGIGLGLFLRAGPGRARAGIGPHV